MDPNGKIIVKNKEDFPTKPIEVSIESIAIALEDPLLTPHTNTRPHKKNFGSVKKKHEMPHQKIHQSSQCRLITQTTYTTTQRM